MVHPEVNKALGLVKWVTSTAVEGFGPFSPAKELANDYRRQFCNPEEAINHLVRWEVAKAGASGFITGVPGLAALPVTIPAGLGVSYLFGGRVAAAVADLRGWDIDSDVVRSAVGLCLLGDTALEVAKDAGISIGIQLSKSLISQIPRRTIIEINKRVGFRLITKAGEKGVINLMKIVPIVGGVVGAGFDGAFVNGCAGAAKMLFASKDE